MFDIGFPELMLVSVVALLVLGPERLPTALRTLGLWLGRLRRSFNSVKTEIEREIGMDDIRRQLHNEAILKEMQDIRQGLQDATTDVTQPTHPSNQVDAKPLDAADLEGPPRSGATDPGAEPGAAGAPAAAPAADAPAAATQHRTRGAQPAATVPEHRPPQPTAAPEPRPGDGGSTAVRQTSSPSNHGE